MNRYFNSQPWQNHQKILRQTPVYAIPLIFGIGPSGLLETFLSPNWALETTERTTWEPITCMPFLWITCFEISIRRFIRRMSCISAGAWILCGIQVKHTLYHIPYNLIIRSTHSHSRCRYKLSELVPIFTKLRTERILSFMMGANAKSNASMPAFWQLIQVSLASCQHLSAAVWPCCTASANEVASRIRGVPFNQLGSERHVRTGKSQQWSSPTDSEVLNPISQSHSTKKTSIQHIEEFSKLWIIQESVIEFANAAGSPQKEYVGTRWICFHLVIGLPLWTYRELWAKRRADSFSRRDSDLKGVHVNNRKQGFISVSKLRTPQNPSRSGWLW